MAEGWTFAAGRCWACGRIFAFDPDLVPSVPIDPQTNRPPDLGGSMEQSVLQPICSTCVELANREREAMGRTDLIEVLPGAYGMPEGPYP